jgi:hypothetical protein
MIHVWWFSTPLGVYIRAVQTLLLPMPGMRGWAPKAAPELPVNVDELLEAAATADAKTVLNALGLVDVGADDVAGTIGVIRRAPGAKERVVPETPGWRRTRLAGLEVRELIPVAMRVEWETLAWRAGAVVTVPFNGRAIGFGGAGAAKAAETCAVAGVEIVGAASGAGAGATESTSISSVLELMAA